jgi:Rv2525c-like, glycoside hydrolase-like domain
VKRLLGSLLAVCASLAAAAPSSAATLQCRTSDYTMQCGKVPTTPAARTAAATHATLASGGYKYGIDFGWSSVTATTAWKMGARFGGSYLSTHSTKNWTVAMLNSYHARGMGTVAVWETSATRALSGYAAGRSDARSALAEERTLRIPTSKPVYFAVDFDEKPSQVPAVASYFRGVDSVLGVSRVGAYGGYWTVSRLFNAGLIRYGWQTSCWSGGHWDPRAQIQQYAYTSAYDWDRAMTSDYGQAL